MEEEGGKEKEKFYFQEEEEAEGWRLAPELCINIISKFLFKQTLSCVTPPFAKLTIPFAMPTIDGRRNCEIQIDRLLGGFLFLHFGGSHRLQASFRFRLTVTAQQHFLTIGNLPDNNDNNIQTILSRTTFFLLFNFKQATIDNSK